MSGTVPGTGGIEISFLWTLIPLCNRTELIEHSDLELNSASDNLGINPSPAVTGYMNWGKLHNSSKSQFLCLSNRGSIDYKINHTGLLGQLNEVTWYTLSFSKYATCDGQDGLYNLCDFEYNLVGFSSFLWQELASILVPWKIASLPSFTVPSFAMKSKGLTPTNTHHARTAQRTLILKFVYSFFLPGLSGKAAHFQISPWAIFLCLSKPSTQSS